MTNELDYNWRDHVALITKAAASLIPMVGGPLAELITEIIPRRRQERIVEYIRALNTKLERLEADKVSNIMADAEKGDLIESGGYLAARATSSERISQLAEIVFRGLKSDEANWIRRKRLLGLFSEIDDDEFLLLNAYGQRYGKLASEAWEAVDRPEPAYYGSSIEKLDAEKLYELGEQNLLRLGLLRRNFSQVKKGEVPEFNSKSGHFKSRIEISHLGRMLLKEAGIDQPL